jgi:hypothetical protein
MVVPHKKPNDVKYSKRLVTYHQCSGCLTVVKGQRGMSMHMKKCSMSSHSFNQVMQLTSLHSSEKTAYAVDKQQQLKNYLINNPALVHDYFYQLSCNTISGKHTRKDYCDQSNSTVMQNSLCPHNDDHMDIIDEQEDTHNEGMENEVEIESDTCEEFHNANQQLLNQRIAHITSGVEGISMHPRYDCHIELLRILKRKGVPLCLFDEIMNWANKSVRYKSYNFAEDPFTRKTVIESLFSRYDLHGIKPQKKLIYLPSTEQEVEVVIHDVKQSIYSILSDPLLNQENKYYFKNFDSPKIPLDRDNSIICDFYNAQSFQDAEEMYLTDKENEIIVPICLFIDKTHATENGRFTCEPVSMCLMLYDAETRNLPNCWRTLGYIMNQAESEKKQSTAHLKIEDYHECLSEILRPLLALQLENGIAWRIPFKG